MNEKIGFIGLGTMGKGMCKNLLKAQFDLTIWNRTASKATPLIELGAKKASDPEELAKTSNIICICVSDTHDVKEIALGNNGLISSAPPNTLIIDFSTISPEITKQIAQEAQKKNIHWIDAPVSGGSEGAENATLSIMAGGEEDQIKRAMPILQTVGKSIVHIGPTGAGQMAKLVNQILVVVNMLAVSEALLFAKAGGLNLEKTLQAVEKGAAGSWMLSNRGTQAIADYWEPGFTIDLQQKDLRLVLDTAREINMPLLATSMVFQLYLSLQKEGLGSKGNHALIKALEKLSGISLNDTQKREI